MSKKSKSKDKKSKHKYNVAEAYFQSQCPCVLNNSCNRTVDEIASVQGAMEAVGYVNRVGPTSFRPSIGPTSLLGVSAYPVI